MDISTIVIAGVAILAVVVVFTFRNRKTADSILQENNNVVPLMLQKSTQMKVTRLQQVTQSNTDAQQKLQNLVTAYKSSQMNIQQYNEKLDAMIVSMQVEL